MKSWLDKLQSAASLSLLNPEEELKYALPFAKWFFSYVAYLCKCQTMSFRDPFRAWHRNSAYYHSKSNICSFPHFPKQKDDSRQLSMVSWIAQLFRTDTQEIRVWFPLQGASSSVGHWVKSVPSLDKIQGRTSGIKISVKPLVRSSESYFGVEAREEIIPKVNWIST